MDTGLVVLGVIFVVLLAFPFFMKSIDAGMKKIYAGFWVAIVVGVLLSAVFYTGAAMLIALAGWIGWIIYLEDERRKNSR